MKKEELHSFIRDSKGNESNITQIYAMKDGELIYEDCWRGFSGDDAANVNSVTKGIMALLAGIALDQGSIQSLDQKVMEFFPEYSPKRGETTIYDVTIRHLLTMTAPYKGKSEPWKKVCTSEDWTLVILWEAARGSQENFDMRPLAFRSWPASSNGHVRKSALILPTGICLCLLDCLSEFLMAIVPKRISLIFS